MSSDDGEVLAARYGDANRAFVQALLARGTITFAEAQPVLAEIFTARDEQQYNPDDITLNDFEMFVAAAAAALSPFDYAIRSTFHQVTHKRTWAIINDVSDPVTQLATIRNPDELAYIKRLLDLIFHTNNTKKYEVMAFRYNDALAEAKVGNPKNQRRESLDEDGEPLAVRPKDNSIGQGDAEKLVRTLVEEGWFELSRNKFYTLTPRALMELKGYLMEMYNEPDAEEGEWQPIKTCAACKEIVTVGQRCEDRECNVRVHDICLDTYWKTSARRRGGGGSTQQQQGGKNCGGCGREWKGNCFVGEKAAPENGQSRKKRTSQPSRRAVQQEVVEDEDDEDEDMGEPSGRGGEEDADGDTDEDDE